MAKFIDDIMENYRKLEHELVTQLSYEVEHGVITGSNREEIWVDFFRRIVPKKFNIARSVFIMDSYSESSKEVDIHHIFLIMETLSLYRLRRWQQ